MTRIDAKLDALRSRDESADEQLADHENRLRTLERRMWTASGAAAAVGGAAGWIAQALGNG